MLSMQHAMLGFCHRGTEPDRDYLAGLLLPDAIRAYSGPRQYSHFERSDDGRDVSWWEMPYDVESLTAESVSESLAGSSHLANNGKAPFGQETDVMAFVAHNAQMMGERRPELYKGVLAHLSAQDVPFDYFVRTYVVDVSEMCRPGGKLYVRPALVEAGRIPDGIGTHLEDGRAVFDTDADARNCVTAVEQHGIYQLAGVLWDEYGITADQRWFDNDLAAEVRHIFPEDLAAKTMRFMKIDPGYDSLIKAHDFSLAENGPLPKKLYDALYEVSLDEQLAIDQDSVPELRNMREAGEALREIVQRPDPLSALHADRSPVSRLLDTAQKRERLGLDSGRKIRVQR